MISLLKAGLVAREFAHNLHFERSAADPRSTQTALLTKLIRRNAKTVFGREHRFASIQTYADFSRQVPIRDYEGFRPYVDRLSNGEHGVLTGDVVTRFTTTSGTTGAPKFIPVTKRWQSQMASLTRLWMYRAVRDHPRCFDQKVLLLVSPAIEGRTPAGLAFGAMSGLTSEHVPRLARRHYPVPSGTVSCLDDHDDRNFLIMRLAMAQSLSAIGTPNPTSLLRLAEVANRRSEGIIRSIRDGTLGIETGSLPDDPSRRAELTRLGAALRPDTARATFLERAVSKEGDLSPAACWPDLDLVGCWLGGNAGAHASKLADHYGSTPTIRDLGFMASEGRFTVPVIDGTASGPLALEANFYEFIPEDEIGNPTPTVLLADELRLGERYYVLVTSPNGLYRYDINDVIEVQGFHARNPTVAFIRKGRDVLSITGEKLHLNHVQAALRTAERASGVRIWQSRLIANVEEWSYDLLVEPQEQSIDERGAEILLRSFDESLCEQNSEYRSKRASQRLRAPRLHVMAPGWSEDLCLTDFRAGRRESQHKWPLLAESWDSQSRAQVLAHF